VSTNSGQSILPGSVMRLDGSAGDRRCIHRPTGAKRRAYTPYLTFGPERAGEDPFFGVKKIVLITAQYGNEPSSGDGSDPGAEVAKLREDFFLCRVMR
jgi:hypothetical protein